MPLMVQENYLRPFEKGPRRGESDEAAMSACARAAELIAISDSMAGNFEVTSSMGVIGTIYPAFLTASDEAGSWRTAFPAFMQKKPAQTKANSLVREMHSRMRAVSTCSCRSMTTTNYHDLLHKRLLHPLTFGDTKSCAAMLHGCGLGREFFTDQAPAIRAPLGLDDLYKRIEGNHKHQLLQDLQSYQSSVSSTKRKKENFGGAGGDSDAEDGDGGRRPFGNKKKKPEAKKGATSSSKGTLSADRAALQSLNQWLPKTADGAGERVKKVTMVLKFIEGHTNAVRRQVSLDELMAPWRDF
jgi:hypothetical protein